jgi:hypothetical protein
MGRSQKSSSSPRIEGVQWIITVENTLWGMAPGVAVVLGSSLALRVSHRHPGDSYGRRGVFC